MADLKFKFIEHPSDVGLLVYGKDTKEIFENAALGMFSLMADTDRINATDVYKFAVEGEDLETLLVNCLNELIFFEDSKKILLKDFKIQSLSATRLEAEAFGEKIDPEKHFIYRPVKAATYNQLQLGENQAKIVFDV